MDEAEVFGNADRKILLPPLLDGGCPNSLERHLDLDLKTFPASQGLPLTGTDSITRRNTSDICLNSKGDFAYCLLCG